MVNLRIDPGNRGDSPSDRPGLQNRFPEFEYRHLPGSLAVLVNLQGFGSWIRTFLWTPGLSFG